MRSARAGYEDWGDGDGWGVGGEGSQFTGIHFDFGLNSPGYCFADTLHRLRAHWDVTLVLKRSYFASTRALAWTSL